MPNLMSKFTGKLPKSITRIIVLAVIAAVVVVGAFYLFSSSTRTVTARFASAVGVYPGTPVKILGVNVGEVTDVSPKADYVEVKMEYDDTYKLPAQAGAVEVANSLVSDRFVQLAPAYRSGPVMKSGAVIPVKHTGAPAELDDITSALNKLSVTLGPAGANKGGKAHGALSALVNVAAANLKGNGAALGNSITKLSEAARTLADNRGNLFATVRNLQKFTTTLKSSDGQVRLFNTQLAQVAGDLAGERTDLGLALHDLGIALDAVGSFVKTNASKFHKDIGGLRVITNILVKQKASVNETLAVAPVALANIVHAYDPNPGVIATRSNMASFGNLNLGKISLQAICDGLRRAGGLPSLGGNISSVCTALGVAPPVGIPPLPASGTPSTPGTGTIGGLVGGTP